MSTTYRVELEYADGDATRFYVVRASSPFTAIVNARGLFHDEFPHFDGRFTAITSREA